MGAIYVYNDEEFIEAGADISVGERLAADKNRRAIPAKDGDLVRGIAITSAKEGDYCIVRRVEPFIEEPERQ